MKVGDKIYCIEELVVYSPYLKMYRIYNQKGRVYFISEIKDNGNIGITTEVYSKWNNTTNKLVSSGCFSNHFVGLIELRRLKLERLERVKVFYEYENI